MTVDGCVSGAEAQSLRSLQETQSALLGARAMSELFAIKGTMCLYLASWATGKCGEVSRHLPTANVGWLMGLV